ncbi:MAG: YciI family protein [Vulcanimicrobiaceae bacterium]
MAKQQFVLRLIPPRPTFAQDMTEEEAGLMRQHVAYWSDFASKGVAIVFGLVLDPKGAWGMGAIEVDDAEQLNALMANDPALKAGNRYEVYPARLNAAQKAAI